MECNARTIELLKKTGIRCFLDILYNFACSSCEYIAVHWSCPPYGTHYHWCIVQCLKRCWQGGPIAWHFKTERLKCAYNRTSVRSLPSAFLVVNFPPMKLTTVLRFWEPLSQTTALTSNPTSSAILILFARLMKAPQNSFALNGTLCSYRQPAKVPLKQTTCKFMKNQEEFICTTVA
uniref:Uncharacterized protein n=1 Tax=Glossina pallidipes TaxID=7398 RepID=A0A1A9ZV21_GLOPL